MFRGGQHLLVSSSVAVCDTMCCLFWSRAVPNSGMKESSVKYQVVWV